MTRAPRPFARLFQFRGLGVILLWQAPVTPVFTPDGSITLAFGTGTDEIIMPSCEGSPPPQEVTYSVAAVEVEGNVAERMRFAGAGGVVMSDSDGHAGGFGGFTINFEGRIFGVGAGGSLVRVPDLDQSPAAMMPSGYLRVGPAERLHARADLYRPSAMMSQQLARAGIGWNATRRDRAAGFLGIAALGADQGVSGVAGELAVPLTGSIGFTLSAHYAPGREHSITGAALGGRLQIR